jgi:protein-serine/threonine kinase
MGQDESLPSFSERPATLRQPCNVKKPPVKLYEPKTICVTTSSRTISLTIPEENLTCGWLLCEVMRLCGEFDQQLSGRIVSLSSGKSESLDCWLLLYDRSLIPFKNNDKISPVLALTVPSKMSLAHFHPIKVIGKGGFSNVTAVRKKDTGNLYAIKTMNKDFVLGENKIEQIMTEKEILSRISHPFIVQMFWAFQTNTQLHLVLELCPGGELFYHLHNLGRFVENQARFYFAEVVLALEYLHGLNIVYRDLKPENILLDIDGHIRITDFGLSKQNIGKRDRSYSICGSPEYMAPEMLLSGEHGLTVDFYTLGALLFEMLTGLPPFYDKNRSRMRWKILNEDLEVPGYISKAGRDLLISLLEKNPEKRLGFLGTQQVKDHEFCKGLNWTGILNKEVKPPLRPYLRRSNFDPEYKKVQIDPEYFKNTPFGDSGFEGFEFDSDGKTENMGPGEASYYSNMTTNMSNVSGGHSHFSEKSRKNRSEILSTEHSRNEEIHKSRN